MGLIIENVSKQFKNKQTPALDHVSLEIEQDDFFVLLGPSGCGKSTLLRMIAGLTFPTEGRIFLDGEDITEQEPQDRGIGMVFQNYALFPHMTVEGNMNFPLKLAKKKRKERHELIRQVSDQLEIGKNLKKKPDQLSGGERQRAAMGRAMVKPSKVYLFDEPLSNLDQELRTRLRPELLKQFHELQVPFVYVTHDQVDAMTMATKVAVMKDGAVQQVGSPQDIYERPGNLFVAGFLGSPRMNFLNGVVLTGDSSVCLKIGDSLFADDLSSEELRSYQGKEIVIGIRPEDVTVSRRNEDDISIVCTLKRYEHLGDSVLLYTEYQGAEFVITAPVFVKAKVGEKLEVFAAPEKLHFFDPKTEERIAAN